MKRKSGHVGAPSSSHASRLGLLLGRRQPGCDWLERSCNWKVLGAFLGGASLYLLGSWRKHRHNSLIISLFRIFPYWRRPFSWFVWISAISWQTFMHTHELWELKWALFWTMAYINPTPRLKAYLYVQSHSLTMKTCKTPMVSVFFPGIRHHFPDYYISLSCGNQTWFDCCPSYKPPMYDGIFQPAPFDYQRVLHITLW